MESLPRMLRAWGPSLLELTARHYWYLSGSCVSWDLTDKSGQHCVSPRGRVRADVHPQWSLGSLTPASSCRCDLE